jgi:hypothetical protein
VHLVLLLAATVASYPLGLAVGVPWVLPLLNAAPAYALMVARLRRGDRRGAVTATLVWAVALAVVGTTWFILWPDLPAGRILNGGPYRDEMFGWIRTGQGPEGSPSLFLPQHAQHLGAFVALSLVSASAASILMGAVLMNYMSFYVASLAKAGVPAWAVVGLGWQPWAVCRVAAFCTLGAVLAEPLLSRLLRYPYAGLGAARRYLAWAAVGLLADLTLKAALAPLWGARLRALMP